jgi:hypothetical protein
LPARSASPVASRAATPRMVSASMSIHRPGPAGSVSGLRPSPRPSPHSRRTFMAARLFGTAPIRSGSSAKFSTGSEKDCNGGVTQSRILKVTVSYLGNFLAKGVATENDGSDALKYGVTSPKKCLYDVNIFEGTFAIPGLTEAEVSSEGTLVSSESETGCATTDVVDGHAVLIDEKAGIEPKPFYAVLKE